MNTGGKGAALASLKTKLQSLRDELDKTKDEYDQKCKECEGLDGEKNQVIVWNIYDKNLLLLILFEAQFNETQARLCVPSSEAKE